MPDLLTALLERDDDAFQERRVRVDELARDLVAASFVTGEFTLDDGSRSDYVFHPDLFMSKPTVLRRLVSVLASSVPHEADRIAGTEPGSLPIVAGLSLETGLPYVSLRERRDGERLSFAPRGEAHEGEAVVLIEDVATTGARALTAARALTGIGARVVAVVSVIDRNQGAAELLAREGLVYDPLFSVDDLLAQRDGLPRSAR